VLKQFKKSKDKMSKTKQVKFFTTIYRVKQ